MEYQGYVATVELDDDAGVFHGRVHGIRDVVTFEGRSVAQLRRAFKDSVDDYLEYCSERGEEPDKPFSGKLLLRLPPELHRTLWLAARRAGMSLNQWIVTFLRDGAA